MLEPESLSFNPSNVKVFFASQLNDIPNGLTTTEMTLIGGVMTRATLSAFVTPIDLGSNSTKNNVRQVNANAPYRSPFAPKEEATRWVKTVVAKIEHAVEATRIVVRTLVMSSFKIPKVPRFPSFSSSSANSLTFHGYRVVMAISAAWSNASTENKVKNKPQSDAKSLLFGLDVMGHNVTSVCVSGEEEKNNEIAPLKKNCIYIYIYIGPRSTWRTKYNN